MLLVLFLSRHLFRGHLDCEPPGGGVAARRVCPFSPSPNPQHSSDHRSQGLLTKHESAGHSRPPAPVLSALLLLSPHPTLAKAHQQHRRSLRGPPLLSQPLRPSPPPGADSGGAQAPVRPGISTQGSPLGLRLTCTPASAPTGRAGGISHLTKSLSFTEASRTPLADPRKGGSAIKHVPREAAPPAVGPEVPRLRPRAVTLPTFQIYVNWMSQHTDKSHT